MSFAGYLLKVNGNIIPMKYIAHKSYRTTPNTIIDLDAYRDADGRMHRSPLPHTVSSIEFNTPYIHLNEKMALQDLLPSRKILAIQYWNDETNTYTSGDFYIPDVTYEIYGVDGNDILYSPIAYKFIEY